MPLWYNPETSEYEDGPSIQADIDWDRERDRLEREARFCKPDPSVDRMAIDLDDRRCGFCHGGGFITDENPYGGQTISDCAYCAGTGSRASLTVAADHFEKLQRAIMAAAAG